MKICPKCKKKYTDDYEYCNLCGCRLEQQKIPFTQNRNVMIALIIVTIVAIIGVGIGFVEQRKISTTRKEIERYKYNKSMEEYRNTPTTSDIKINSGWKTEKRGNYIYIKGTVTNTSLSKTISYYEVEAKFYDRFGNIIDSDWTNDARKLEPGESRKFEIMHKYSYEEKDIKLSIKDVN